MLTRVAATGVPESKATFSDWKARVRLFGDALDKEDELEKILAELDQQLEAMHAYWQTPQTVSVVRWNPQGPILMSSKLFTGQLIQEARLITHTYTFDMDTRPHRDTYRLDNLY